ncbi:MAG: host specificity protein J, partial [Pseudomonadales bacterium 32-61-5]
SGGWSVRVRRLTPNSTSSAIADTVNIKSFTEIIDAKFRYPNSAIVGVSFDAETFGGSVPRRGYHARGRIIRVPSNYAPESRTYTGIWDGTFQLAYSNNPAWIYYDLLLHPRYGLGDRIDASQVDKWGLYQIGQYCDQLVSDGKGGQEPRFVCNLYLQKRADAYKALQDIAAVFRGITYWGAGQAIVSADMPADPVYTYTNANVKNGKFSYKGSKRSTRYSAVLVGWNDPSDMYRQKVEYVQDDDAIARFGVQTTEITALGCTSQGQAQRAGRWALLTNLLETETVTFAVGLDGIRARPGQIIRVADNARAGRRIGGRLSAATTTVVTVDKVEGVQSGDELTCILPSGVAQSVWAWESTSLAAQRYRIVSIAESGPLEYAITASKYVEGKHAAVDSGAIISQRPITAIPSSVQAAPTNIRAISDWMIEQTMAVTTMTILWDAAPGATRYDVEWKRGDGAWVYAGRVGGTELDVVGIYAGSYQIRVRALNSLDVSSPWGYSVAIELAGKAGTPPAVAFLNAAPEIFGIRLEWGFPAGAEDTLRTEIQYNTSQSEVSALHLGDYAYPANTHAMTGLAAGVTFWFRARLIDRTGNIGPWSGWVIGQSSADATAILEYITGQITETELGQNLLARINLIDGDGPGSVNYRIGELADAIEYSPNNAYLAGDSVRDGQRLYQAKIDVPADPYGANAPPNTTYWLDVGQVVQSADGLALQVSQNTASIEEIDGAITAQASTLEALQATWRDDDGEGELADALRGWQTQAQYAQEVRVRATDNEAMAERVT